MKITGEMREVERHRVKAPEDGVQRNSDKDGLLKGCKSAWLNGEYLCSKGMTSVYIKNKEDTGVKIYYSLHWFKPSSKKVVIAKFNKHLKMYKLGIAAKPYKVVDVDLDFMYYDKRGECKKHVKCHAYGIKVQHVFYPEKAWEVYASGKPYDWNALDQKEYPDHNPKGYHKFVKFMTHILKKHKIGCCGN